jgi:hypothetical protein
MSNQPLSDRFAVVVVVLLLILVAFGNHMATFEVALVLLAAIVFLFRQQGMVRGGIFAATAGCVVTIVIELIRLLPIR